MYFWDFPNQTSFIHCPQKNLPATENVLMRLVLEQVKDRTTRSGYATTGEEKGSFQLRAGSRLSSNALFGRLLFFRVQLISVILNKAPEPISCYDIRMRRIMHWLLEGVEIGADVDVRE